MAAATVVSPRISPQESTRPVGGDDDRGLQVALGDDLEQRGGGLGGQRQVAQLVDDKEGGSGVEAHGGGPPAFDRGAVAAGGEVGGGGEVGAVAGVRGGAGQTDGEVGLADPGWPDQQHVGGGLQVAAGAELGDQVPVEAGGGVVVEVLQAGGGGQAGEPEPAGEPAGLGGVDLEGEQPFQRGGQRRVLRRWLGRGRRAAARRRCAAAGWRGARGAAGSGIAAATVSGRCVVAGNGSEPC